MTPRDVFNALVEYPQPSRTEVLTAINTLTQNYNQEYTKALLADLENMLDEWKYNKVVERLEEEYNEKILDPYYTALYRAKYDLAMGTNEPIEWPEEPAPFIAPPPFPGCYDDSLIYVAPMYEYAIDLLKSHTKPESPTTVTVLPSELDTERARKYFARAVEAGYMIPTDTGYRWVMGAAVKLGYFVERVYCSTDTEQLPETALNRLFGVNRLGSAITQMHSAKKHQKWRGEIDKQIFFD